MNNNTNKTMQTLVMMLMMVLAAIAGPIAITPASNAEDQTAFPTEVREVPQLNTLTRARKGSKKGARPQNGGNKGNKRKSGNGPAKGKTSLKERFNARFKSQRRLGELDMYCQKKQLQNPDMMAREMAHHVHAEGGNPNRVAAEYLYTRIKHLTPTLGSFPKAVDLVLRSLFSYHRFISKLAKGDKTANIQAPVLVKELQKLINRDNTLGDIRLQQRMRGKEAFVHWVFANKQGNDGLAIKLGTASTKLAKYSANTEYERELQAHLQEAREGSEETYQSWSENESERPEALKMNFMLIDEKKLRLQDLAEQSQRPATTKDERATIFGKMSDIKGELTTLSREVIDQIVAQAEAAFIEERGDKKAYSGKLAAKTRREVTENNKPHVYNLYIIDEGKCYAHWTVQEGMTHTFGKVYLYNGEPVIIRKDKVLRYDTGEQVMRTNKKGQEVHFVLQKKEDGEGFIVPDELTKTKTFTNAAIPMHHYGVIGTLGPSNGATTSGTDKDGKGFPICGALASLALLNPNQGKLNGVRNDFYKASLNNATTNALAGLVMAGELKPLNPPGLPRNLRNHEDTYDMGDDDDLDQFRKENAEFRESLKELDLEPATADSNEPVIDTTTVDIWEGMTVKDLKAKCRERNLKVGGRKAELIARLQDA